MKVEMKGSTESAKAWEMLSNPSWMFVTRATAMEVKITEPGGVLEQVADGHKGDAAEAGDESFVDLAFVDFVKEIAAEGNQEYLRYKKTCKEYAQNEYAQQVNWPISHNSGA